MLTYERRVHTGELERAHAVARGHERLDQSDGRRGADRIRRGEPAPPAGRGRVILPTRRGERERLERRGELARVAPALGVRPLVELGRLLQPEAFEKGPTMEPRHPLVRALLDRVEQLAHVAGDPLGVELQRRRAEEHVVPPSERRTTWSA